MAEMPHPVSNNPPVRHHYIPAFYLKRWAASDDKLLCQFNRPHKDVIARRRAPDATGYETGLYELKGFDPRLAQQVEEKFFKPVDTAAANSLEMLERHGHAAPWTGDSRSAWTRFIVSLLMRCPEDIAGFREFWPRFFIDTDDELESEFQKKRTVDDPPTMADFIRAQPQTLIESYQARVLMNLIDNEKVGRSINNMHWRVRSIPDDCHPLLTSDRPVIQQMPIDGPNGHVALPIGPRLLFVASSDLNFLERLLKLPVKAFAFQCNKNVVESASSYVYSTDNTQLKFVKNRMGRSPQSRLLADIIKRRDSAMATSM